MFTHCLARGPRLTCYQLTESLLIVNQKKNPSHLKCCCNTMREKEKANDETPLEVLNRVQWACAYARECARTRVCVSARAPSCGACPPAAHLPRTAQFVFAFKRADDSRLCINLSLSFSGLAATLLRKSHAPLTFAKRVVPPPASSA